MKISARANAIEPFYVMEMAKKAQDKAKTLVDTDQPMIFLNIGEPDFTAPPAVQMAAQKAIESGASQYTQATGLPALRLAISHWYAQRFGLAVAAERIVITAGASAALQLACLALVDSGDEILMPDPSYPCNRHFVSAVGGIARMIPSTAEERFQLSAEKVKAAWGPKTHGVLLASPSNPTGTSISPHEMREILRFVASRKGVALIDEIYLPLSYDNELGRSALAVSDQIISINSFSKYFNMTGWRLGWLVVPPALTPVIEKLAQNLYICPSTLAQHAALACFEPETLALYETRRDAFKARRDYFVPALKALGFEVPVVPDGAFYAWADCSDLMHHLGVDNSWDFSLALMEKAHLAVTPGRDFGHAQTGQFIRFSTANDMTQLHTAIARMQSLFQAS
jgi:aspartate/methionine/tyrosine aminotransferase